jgi:hypothetical protein
MNSASNRPHCVTGPNLLNRSAFTLNPAAARGDQERLAEQMRVPRGVRARPA